MSDDFILYHYTPNKPAAIFFAAAFVVGTLVWALQVYHHAKKASNQLKHVGTVLHSAKDPVMGTSEDLDLEKSNTTNYSPSVHDKKLKIISLFCCFIPFLIGSLMEAIGYIARAISSSDKEAVNPYVIQSILLLIAPALYAGTIYMLFGRLLRVLKCEKLLLVSSRYGTAFFVAGDVFSFLLQASGGGLMATNGRAKTGSNIVTVGLAIQIAFFGFFIINEIRFSSKVAQTCPFHWQLSKKWFFMNMVLLISSVLIMLRSIVRLVEFIQGHNGFIMAHEYFIYVFDAIPMFLVIVTFYVGSSFGNIFNILVEVRKLR